MKNTTGKTPTLFIFELNYLKDKGETMKSGVYFVHYDDIDAFLKHIASEGRELDELVAQLKLPNTKTSIEHFQLITVSKPAINELATGTPTI